VSNHISPPDIVTLSGPGVKVLSSGEVTDRFFKRVEAVKRRPERVELDSISGMQAERVQFVISGSGTFKITVDSAKGGVVNSEGRIPVVNRRMTLRLCVCEQERVLLIFWQRWSSESRPCGTATPEVHLCSKG
jgi:hypothetical protein